VRRVLEHLGYSVTRLIASRTVRSNSGLLEARRRGGTAQVLAEQLGSGGGAAAEKSQRLPHHRRSHRGRALTAPPGQ